MTVVVATSVVVLDLRNISSMLRAPRPSDFSSVVDEEVEVIVVEVSSIAGHTVVAGDTVVSSTTGARFSVPAPKPETGPNV